MLTEILWQKFIFVQSMELSNVVFVYMVTASAKEQTFSQVLICSLHPSTKP